MLSLAAHAPCACVRIAALARDRWACSTSPRRETASPAIWWATSSC